MSNTPPYFTVSPRPIDAIEIKPIESTSPWDYQIRLGEAGYLHITTTDLNAVIRGIVERLYDDGSMSMDTADHVAYLCQNILADREMPVAKPLDPSYINDGWTDPTGFPFPSAED